jgi:hypothetical protein
MEIKPGISTSLYISMIFFVTAFSGQNSNTNQTSKFIDITFNSAADSLVGKWKRLEYFQDSNFRTENWKQKNSLNTHGTK